MTTNLDAEEHVGDDVEVVAERQILVDGGHAELGGVVGGANRDALAAPVDLAVVGFVDAGDHLDQCRLAGAVVADQRGNASRRDVEVDVVERGDGTEVLGDPAQGKQDVRDRRAVRLTVSAGVGLPARRGGPGDVPFLRLASRGCRIGRHWRETIERGSLIYLILYVAQSAA